MKKLLFGMLLALCAFLVNGAIAVKADAPDLSGSISATYDANTHQLTTSGDYAWSKCDANNTDKYVGYAIFINGGTPASNDSNALDGAGMHIASGGNPCTTTPGSWSDSSHTLASAPANVCVVVYDVEKDKKTGDFVSKGNHSNVGAGDDKTRNKDNSWDSAGKSGSYASGYCTSPTVIETDVCANIDGVQATVPVGYYQSGNNCLPQTHVCTDPTATNYDSNVDTTEVADSSVCTYAGVTPTPTQTPSNGGGDTHGDGLSDGRSDGLSSCPSCTQAPQANVQAVLGASTMAGTGTFENTVMNFMLVAGMIVLSLGGLSYAKEIKK